ncbi:MAG: fumarylacetoacetate hydrolase family protein [Pseudomonadota bacterium]
MRLVRYGPRGEEKPGLLDGDGVVRDLSDHVPDIGPEAISPTGWAYIAALDNAHLPLVQAPPRLGPPLSGIGKVIGIDLNYPDHVAELGAELPSEPMTFLKATSALTGPQDDIPCPEGADQLDYEVELAVAIGTQARNVPVERALAHVGGYLTFNDISERSWQYDRGGQWVKGKSHDGFAPLGPWLVSPEAVGDPQALGLSSVVNGVVRQASTTRAMLFDVAQIVSYLSQFMTLEPGDLIATGTPAGIGMAQQPPGFLRPGDVLETEVGGLGRQRARIVAA